MAMESNWRIKVDHFSLFPSAIALACNFQRCAAEAVQIQNAKCRVDGGSVGILLSGQYPNNFWNYVKHETFSSMYLCRGNRG